MKPVIMIALLALATPVGASDGLQVIPSGIGASPGASAYFTGEVTAMSPFKGSGESRLAGGTVRFEAGARTHWHSHPLGQLLIVTAGMGWVQAEGEAVRLVRPGDVVWTAPGVRHWHGATASSAMTHVAIAEPKDGAVASWFDPVGADAYQGPE